MNFSGKVGIEAQDFRAERAAEAGEAGADREGDGKHRADLDAEPARHARIVDRGAQPAAEARARQGELQRQRQRAAQHDDEGAVEPDIDAQHLDAARAATPAA